MDLRVSEHKIRKWRQGLKLWRFTKSSLFRVVLCVGMLTTTRRLALPWVRSDENSEANRECY